MTCPVTTALGAYVLGALDPAERADVEEHLPGCIECTHELGELATLPGLLGRLSLSEAVDPSPTPDRRLLDRLLVAIAHDRRVARHRRLLALAAAVVVLAGGSTAGVLLTTGSAPGRPPTVSATDTHTRVHAAVTLTARHWGTEVALRLSGVPPLTRCQLVAHARDGRTEVASTWQATYDGTATVPGATGIAVNDLAELAVVSSTGQQLVALPISGAG